MRYALLSRLFIAALSWAAAAVPATAATYYVAKSGSDTNDGSSDSPWLTVQKAAGMVSPGDQVFVSAGVYPEQVVVATAGSSGSPIRFVADTSLGTVTLGGIFAQAPYLQFSGFTLDGTGVANLQSHLFLDRNASHCTFSDINSAGVPDSIAQGKGVIGMTAPGPNDCTFERITANDPNYNWVTLFGSGHIVRNCTMRGDAGWDVFRILGSNLVIRGNTIYASNELGNHAGHPDFFQSFATGVPGPVQNNLIESNWCIGKGISDNLQIGNMEDQGEQGIVKDFTFRNNVFAYIDRTFNVYPDNFKFYNNTFYRSAKGSNYCIIFDTAGTKGNANNIDIRNNIFYECGDATSPTKGWYAGNAGSGFIADHNLVVGTGAGTIKVGFQSGGRETNGINGYDPKFVDAEGGDFRLQPDSAAVGAALSLEGIFKTDKTGRVRGAIWDIGAYQHTDEEPEIDAPSGLRTVAASP